MTEEQTNLITNALTLTELALSECQESEPQADDEVLAHLASAILLLKWALGKPAEARDG